MNNKKLSIGILGCGGISRWLYVRVLTELCDIAQVVAVCDLEENLAEERKLMFQNAYLEKHLENERLNAQIEYLYHVDGKASVRLVDAIENIVKNK